MDLHEAIDRLLLTGRRAGQEHDRAQEELRYAVRIWRSYCRLVESGDRAKLDAVREAFRCVRDFTEELAAKLGMPCRLCRGTLRLVIAGQSVPCPECRRRQCEVESMYRDLGGEGGAA